MKAVPYLSDRDVTDEQLRSWGRMRFEGLTTKNDIERDYMGDPESHGKRIGRLWRERLGIETEEQHPMRVMLGESMRTRLAMTALDLGNRAEAEGILSAMCSMLVNAGVTDPMED